MASPLAQAAVLVEVKTEVAEAEAGETVVMVATFLAESEAKAAIVRAEVVSVQTFANAEACKTEATVLLRAFHWCCTSVGRAGCAVASSVGEIVASTVIRTLVILSSGIVGQLTLRADALWASVSVDSLSGAITSAD